jgi:hypothetical protein
MKILVKINLKDAVGKDLKCRGDLAATSSRFSYLCSDISKFLSKLYARGADATGSANSQPRIPKPRPAAQTETKTSDDIYRGAAGVIGGNLRENSLS